MMSPSRATRRFSSPSGSVGQLPGHPIAIPSHLCRPLVSFSPETSLKEALRSLHVSPYLLDVDDPGILRDVDVPADLT